MRISDWSSDVCSSDLHLCPQWPQPHLSAAERALSLVRRRFDGAWRRVRERPRHLSQPHGADRRAACRDGRGQGAVPARKSVVLGKSVSVSVDLGGRRTLTSKLDDSYSNCVICRLNEYI